MKKSVWDFWVGRACCVGGVIKGKVKVRVPYFCFMDGWLAGLFKEARLDVK